MIQIYQNDNFGELNLINYYIFYYIIFVLKIMVNLQFTIFVLQIVIYYHYNTTIFVLQIDVFLIFIKDKRKNLHTYSCILSL